MLLGRERECARLDALTGRVLGGASAVLVLSGEAGIGKTSLLEYAAARAAGLRILSARGTVSERNLPFAALADLLRPMLGELDVLPGPQRAALASALALGPAVDAGLLAICTAALSLLGAAAATQPVLMVVDDAHWLDAASARVLEFTARRLGQDAIGLLIAMRRMSPGVPEPERGGFDPAGMDTIVVPGVDRTAASRLLARSGRVVAPAVAQRLAEGTGGNPLALIELPAALTEAQLGGLAVLPDPLPVGAALGRAFALRLDALDPGTRRVLLLAAAATASLGTLQHAAALLSLDIGGLPAAEDAGLIRIADAQVEFTHPLLRSACYYGAAPAERRAAHRALAEASDPDREPIRRAWQLAAATVGTDEAVADTLEEAARTAHGRNALAAASRAYQRAAELTADPDRQVSRWMAAGRAAHLGGDPVSASRLLRRALEQAADPRTRADAQVLLAHAALYTAPPMDMHYELVAAADAVQPVDPARAATLLAVASNLAIISARLALALETAARAARLADGAAGSAGAGGTAWLLSQALLAQATILTGDRATGRGIVRRILGHPGARAADPVVDLVKMRCGQSLMWCEDYQAASEVLGSCLAVVRAAGRVADLPYGLATMAQVYFRTGEWGKAYAHASEAVELGTDVSRRADHGYALVCLAPIEAAMGASASCGEHVAHAIRLARPRGVQTVVTLATAAKGLLELGYGRCQQAAAELAQAASLVTEHGLKDPGVVRWRPDYIESLARLGRLADAREQQSVLEAEAAASGSRWAAAAAARCRGLLRATPREMIGSLEDAVAAAGPAGAFELARTRACLGRALRAAGEPAAARQQLEQALTAFERLGAKPWAESTAAGLAGTGVSAAPRRDPIHVKLTPQELRVALHVAEGLSNQEVAAMLFVSHKTVEVHLGHIYDKLGVRSRTSLARLVHAGELR